MQYLNDEKMNKKLIELKKKNNLKIQVVIAETSIKNDTTKSLIKA